MIRRANLISPVLVALLVWPQLAAAHVPGEEPELLFLFPLFGAFVCFALLGFPTIGTNPRDELGVNLFLAGVGLGCTALTALLFLDAQQTFKAERAGGIPPAIAAEGTP